jgi:hypothetical protein
LRSEAASRAHVIDVTVSALGDELSVTWEYASKVLHPHTASTLAESYVAAIGELADAVLALPAAAHRAPSPEPARMSAQTEDFLPQRHRP